VLHHDGPFDACAPSRNKNRQKAPLFAWTPTDTINDPLASMQDSRNDPSSPYYAAALYQGAGGTTSIPKKRVDALAEAWGIAEPEPYEEFSAGGGNKSANATDTESWSKRHAAPEQPRHSSRTNRVRSTLPPPQPIDLPGSRALDPPSPTYPESPYQQGGANVGRNKSIMARIRKMRDAPNVPVTNHDDSESERDENGNNPGENSVRPGHKHQPSFLGRFRGGPPPARGATSPDGEFVYVEDAKEKDLPSPPPPADYFVAPSSSERGVSRKTSLMNKIKGGVRGRRNSKS